VHPRQPRYAIGMPIRTRRWNDPAEPGDGFRVLVSRYRPRALPKGEETWEEWVPQLGPSPALHADFYGKTGTPIDLAEYTRRYLEEMRGVQQQARTIMLAERVQAGETITLLCSSACTDPARCHRTLLADLVQAVVGR
jgi:uncharacterized protein YeaO (DUF488 family)